MLDPKDFLVFKESARVPYDVYSNPQEGDTRMMDAESVPGGYDNPIDPASGTGINEPISIAKDQAKRDYREGVPQDNPGGGTWSEEEVQAYFMGLQEAEQEAAAGGTGRPLNLNRDSDFYLHANLLSYEHNTWTGYVNEKNDRPYSDFDKRLRDISRG